MIPFDNKHEACWRTEKCLRLILQYLQAMQKYVIREPLCCILCNNIGRTNLDVYPAQGVKRAYCIIQYGKRTAHGFVASKTIYNMNNLTSSAAKVLQIWSNWVPCLPKSETWNTLAFALIVGAVGTFGLNLQWFDGPHVKIWYSLEF